jgi:hypothetical protein
LAFQSPRVYEGKAREKLLRLSTLAYAFLLTLLDQSSTLFRLWLLRYYASRTRSHWRTAKLPLTRLRCALSRVWQDWPPNFVALAAPPLQVQVTEVV